MANPTKATRNRPSSTASAWVKVKGNRYRRFARAVFCPSGVLRSSAVSAMDLPESAGADDTTAGQDRDHGGAGSWRSPSKRLLEAVAPSKPAHQQKGRPEGRPFRE